MSHTIKHPENRVELKALLGLMEMLFVLGLLASVAALAGTDWTGNGTILPSWRPAFNAAYFGIGAVSVIAILRWRKWGVYTLGVASVIMGAANILENYTNTAATLVVAVFAAVIGYYLWRTWDNFR